MNGWSAIQYIGSGLSLVSFVVAAALYAYRARLRHQADIIKSAPEKDRLEAIATAAEFFRVDVSKVAALLPIALMTWSRRRARRDITVPIGTPVTSAISRYDSPCTSRRIIVSRPRAALRLRSRETRRRLWRSARSRASCVRDRRGSLARPRRLRGPRPRMADGRFLRSHV
jgi:hypothetical protein